MGEWSELVLGDSLEVLIDNRGRNPEFSLAGIPLLSGQSIKETGIDLSAVRYVSEDTYAQWMPKPIRRGDLILTSEAPLGRVALVRTDELVALGQRIFGMRGAPGILDTRFLYYSFQTVAVQSDLAARATGTTVVGIRNPELRKVRIPAPSIAEQRSIAEVLGALDDKIAANDRVAKSSRELARLIYARAVAGVDGVPMSSVLEPFLGGTPSRSDESAWDGSVPWVSAKDITGASNGVIIETVEGISEAASRAKRLRALPSGSVILTARGTVGVVARLAIDSAVNQSCYAFEPGQIPAASLVFVIENASAQAKSMAHGSVFDTITMRTFDHVNVPSLSVEQWQRVESTIAPLLDTTRQAVIESARLAKTRDELLPLLMSGKVRVTDEGAPALA